MTRRPSASIVANPVLVGAVTVLVIVVAVFLAYNANNGLPFVPTREILVDIGSGSQLVTGNEVREGGYRIGVVEEIQPRTLPTGQTVAQLKLKLDKTVGEIPVDTTVTIRPRSALGLKYVEFNRGRSGEGMVDGERIPLSQTHVPVQFDDIFKIFDARTRKASQDNLNIFGSGFAGRGESINRLIVNLNPLLTYLRPVAANLSDPNTGLVRFFREVGDFVRVVAPVAEVQARVFSDMATTFEAFSRDPDALRDTIAKSPPTLIVGTRSLRDQRPFLRDFVLLSRDLRPAARDLRIMLPTITDALRRGVPTLQRTPELNALVLSTLRTLQNLAETPTTNQALRALTDTVGTLNPMVRFLGPYQTVCNYWNYFWYFLGEHISADDPSGTAQRANINSTPAQKNSPGELNNYEPWNGELNEGPAGVVDALRNAETGNDLAVYHNQIYHAAIDDQGRADCEAGQRGYPEGPLAVNAPPVDVDGDPVHWVVDPHTPGNQGPTYAGRNRVPEGQTFSREPEQPEAAQLPDNLTTGIYGG